MFRLFLEAELGVILMQEAKEASSSEEVRGDLAARGGSENFKAL